MSSLVSKIDQLLSVLLLEELAPPPFALTNIPPKLSAFWMDFWGLYSDDSDALSFCSCVLQSLEIQLCMPEPSVFRQKSLHGTCLCIFSVWAPSASNSPTTRRADLQEEGNAQQYHSSPGQDCSFELRAQKLRCTELKWVGDPSPRVCAPGVLDKAVPIFAVWSQPIYMYACVRMSLYIYICTYVTIFICSMKRF